MNKIENILGHITEKMNSVQPTRTATADVRALVKHFRVHFDNHYLIYIIC